MNKQEQLVQTKEQHKATNENKQATTAAAHAESGSNIESVSIAGSGSIIDSAEQQEGHADQQSLLSEQTPSTPPATGSGEWKELYKAIATYAKEVQKARL